MGLFDDIEQAYSVCQDGFIALAPHTKGLDVFMEQADAEKIVNDALILRLFARFEAEVNRRCEVLIRLKRSAPDWLERRCWDSLDPKYVKNMPFKNRLALLMDRGRREYARAVMLYDIRNDLAHGVDFEVEEGFLTVAAALKNLLAAMEENP
jgi:hypothetical protein